MKYLFSRSIRIYTIVTFWWVDLSVKTSCKVQYSINEKSVLRKETSWTNVKIWSYGGCRLLYGGPGQSGKQKFRYPRCLFIGPPISDLQIRRDNSNKYPCRSIITKQWTTTINGRFVSLTMKKEARVELGTSKSYLNPLQITFQLVGLGGSNLQWETGTGYESCDPTGTFHPFVNKWLTKGLPGFPHYWELSPEDLRESRWINGVSLTGLSNTKISKQIKTVPLFVYSFLHERRLHGCSL